MEEINNVYTDIIYRHLQIERVYLEKAHFEKIKENCLLSKILQCAN